MPPVSKGSDKPRAESHDIEPAATQLRIIGGRSRGRSLVYSGDPRTRPMKDRVREAVFNLIGPRVVGSHAVDLFAGTGALGLEALSRGAVRATFIERHYPTTKLIEKNAAAIDMADRAEVRFGDAFAWSKRLTLPSDVRWLVFCSPPYDFYVERQEEMLAMLGRLVHAAPSASVFVVEADERFDFSLLPQAGQWDVRTYDPAHVGLWEKPVP